MVLVCLVFVSCEDSWIADYSPTNIHLNDDFTFTTTYRSPTQETEESVVLEYHDYNLPVLHITGSLSGVSKENKVRVQIDYYDSIEHYTSHATLKVQGSSSARYPKKNFNMQLYKDETYGKKNKLELVNGWGEQSKYTLKANYIDFTHARNIVSGRLYGEIAKNNHLGDGIEKAPNGGVVDGYPILVFLNNEYYGLYTLNIPKDGWMYGLKDDVDLKSAILMASNYKPQAYLEVDVTTIAEDNDECMELEFKGDEATEPEILNSFNTFGQKVRQIDSRCSLYSLMDANTITRAIDVMIFVWVIGGFDNTGKNSIWVTYDGDTWLPSVYDMDSTFGLWWTGNEFVDPKTGVIPSENLGNYLWRRIYSYDLDRVKTRYAELRRSTLSYDNIIDTFEEFINTIPPEIKTLEEHKWPEIPNRKRNNIVQIRSFTRERLKFLDSMMGYEE